MLCESELFVLVGVLRMLTSKSDMSHDSVLLLTRLVSVSPTVTQYEVNT